MTILEDHIYSLGRCVSENRDCQDSSRLKVSRELAKSPDSGPLPTPVLNLLIVHLLSSRLLSSYLEVSVERGISLLSSLDYYSCWRRW